MPRSISIYRRRANLIDMNWPLRLNIRSYILKFASNFDSAFAPFANIPAAGFKSKTVTDSGLTSEQFRGKTRIIFNPVDFTIDDTKPIWLRVAPIDINGIVGADETMHLILPYAPPANRPIILYGTAPAAADISGSLELQLPQQCKNITIQVDSSDFANYGTPADQIVPSLFDLYVAFEPKGTEFRVPTLSSQFTNFESVYPAASQLFIRGNTEPTSFHLSAEIRDNSLNY